MRRCAVLLCFVKSVQGTRSSAVCVCWCRVGAVVWLLLGVSHSPLHSAPRTALVWFCLVCVLCLTLYSNMSQTFRSIMCSSF